MIHPQAGPVIMGAMGFFDLPELEPDDDELEGDDDDDDFEGMRPAAWIPGVVPVELLLARSDDAAVVLSRLSAFPDGFELTVNSYLRLSVKRSRRAHLHHPMMWHGMAEPGEPIPLEILRFGVAWPDGGRATNLGDWGRNWPDATEPGHGLDSHGGGGSDREYSQQYWAWPLPAAGPLRFVVEWPAFGIEETTASIEGELLVEAATRARPVWTDDAGMASHLSGVTVMRTVRAHRGDGEPTGGLNDH
jgi:hypothetical protein